MKNAILDTNFILRYLLEDVESQFKEAREVFKAAEDGKLKLEVSLLVMNELIWVSENFYHHPRSIYIPRIIKLISPSFIKVREANKELIIRVFEHMLKQKFDFTDWYLYFVKGKTKLLTFDKDFGKMRG